MFSEQLQYRELLFRIVSRDLMLRYKQTFMGVAWAVFMPLVNTAIFSAIFTRVAPLDPGMPYPLYAYSGLVAWNFFASSLRFAIISLTSNTNLVTKVYFPREIFPFSAIIVALVDTVVAAAVMIVIMIHYGITPGPAALLVPVVLLVQVAFTAAMALVLAMANLFYRDVKYLFEIVIAVGMFATSVVYPTDQIGGRLGPLLALNPMTAIIDAYRATLLKGQLPGEGFWIAASVSVVGLAIGWLIFHRAEFQFAENI